MAKQETWQASTNRMFAQIGTSCLKRFVPSHIRELIDTIFQKDPAAHGILQIVLCYPGFHAILLYRLAHKLYCHNCRILALALSQLARSLTGIEIHPAAVIGRRFFIDHGMGVVIGETARIGNDVLLYQGVTLGGTGKQKGKRHPTVRDGVIIGAGAQILGNVEIGDHVKIGAGSVVVASIPPCSTVVGVPGRVVRWLSTTTGACALNGAASVIPEPDTLDLLTRRIERLEARIRSFEELAMHEVDMAKSI